MSNRNALNSMDKALKELRTATREADEETLRLSLGELGVELAELRDGLIAAAQLAGEMDDYEMWNRED